MEDRGFNLVGIKGIKKIRSNQHFSSGGLEHAGGPRSRSLEVRVKG